MNATQKPTDYDIRSKTLREIINARLRDLGVSRYRLAHSGMTNIAPATVYRYLSGESETVSGNLEQLLKACGLQIVPSRRVPTWARKRYAA